MIKMVVMGSVSGVFPPRTPCIFTWGFNSSRASLLEFFMIPRIIESKGFAAYKGLRHDVVKVRADLGMVEVMDARKQLEGCLWWKTKRKATEISQSSGPTTLIVDETVYEEKGDNVERDATTAASIDAEQDSGNIIRTQSMTTLNKPNPQGTGSGSDPRHQDTILGGKQAQTRFERLSKQSSDPPLSRVNTLGSGEDSMKLNELIKRVTKLEIEEKSKNFTKSSGGFQSQDSVLSVDMSLEAKDKGKAKMIEPKKPLKKKDQILVDEEIAQRLQEELQAELEEEERLARQKEEEDNLISWDNTQAMMEADYELAQRLQAEEQGELTIEERSKLFVELMDKRKKHFAKLRAEEIRRKPPTKAQKRNQMCTYLKNMANYKHSQLKNKSFEEIQMLFDNTMKWVDSFVPMDTEVVEGSKIQAEGSKKRTREELESDNSKKQKIDKNVEDEVDDEAKMKKHMEIVPDDEVAIDATTIH
ncbi:hypothetical protein Tco_0837538 [Tanacetum coccineum]